MRAAPRLPTQAAHSRTCLADAQDIPQGRDLISLSGSVAVTRGRQMWDDQSYDLRTDFPKEPHLEGYKTYKSPFDACFLKKKRRRRGLHTKARLRPCASRGTRSRRLRGPDQHSRHRQLTVPVRESLLYLNAAFPMGGSALG
jgi:hypothetical protein